jgi:hypothetical protein
MVRRCSTLSIVFLLFGILALTPSAFAADPELAWSTYLGGSGSEGGRAAAADGQGNVYVTGGTDSAEFPTTPGAYDVTHNGWIDAFVSKFSRDATLLWSTFLGGGFPDYGSAIAADPAGNVYVTGYTQSATFPITFGAYDVTYNGGGGTRS